MYHATICLLVNKTIQDIKVSVNYCSEVAITWHFDVMLLTHGNFRMLNVASCETQSKWEEWMRVLCDKPMPKSINQPYIWVCISGGVFSLAWVSTLLNGWVYVCVRNRTESSYIHAFSLSASHFKAMHESLAGWLADTLHNVHTSTLYVRGGFFLSLRVYLPQRTLFLPDARRRRREWDASH